VVLVHSAQFGATRRNSRIWRNRRKGAHFGKMRVGRISAQRGAFRRNSRIWRKGSQFNAKREMKKYQTYDYLVLP
jgi:hypothetical protein